MGKPLSEAQKKANQKKLDKAAGRPAKPELPEGEAVPTGILSREIFDLTAKLGAIAANAERAGQVVQDFQKQLDAARSVSAEASVTAIVDDTADARKDESEALKYEEMLRLQFERSRHTLKTLPDVLKKIRDRIKLLRSQRRIEEEALIRLAITDTDMEEIENEAREAVAKLVAYKKMTGHRMDHAIGNMNITGVVSGLDKDHSVDMRYKQVYIALEKSLHFETL